MKTYNVTVDGKAFDVKLIDLEALKQSLNESYFEMEIVDGKIDETYKKDEDYSHEYHRLDFSETDFPTQEDYDKFMNELDSLYTDPQALALKLATEAGKKKNGTFRKNGIIPVAIADGFGLHWEESYCYSFPAVYMKATSDRNLEMETRYHKLTW